MEKHVPAMLLTAISDPPCSWIHLVAEGFMVRRVLTSPAKIDETLLHSAVIIVGFWSAGVAQGRETQSLQLLFERHSWFELRDAIGSRSVPALYAGAVASAFNRSADAERHLRRAVREATTIEAATDAREALANLYMRIGRSSDMIRVLDEALAAAPSRSDFRNVLQAFAPFRKLPNQTARLGRGRAFTCAVGTNGVVLPAVVNGKSVEWLFDSAFSDTALSESEARMLGITAHSAAATAEDFAGGSTSMRTAMVEPIAIGGSEVRNVPVLVFRDSQPPWNAYAPGKRGTIGLPVILALQSIRWARSQTCQVGPNPDRSQRSANLALDGATPVTRVHVSGRTIDMVLDSGNQAGTQLWERFFARLPRCREPRTQRY